MANKHLTEDRLIDLLAGLVSNEEQTSAVAHMRECTLCEDHFRMLARERETLLAKPSPRFVGGEIVLPSYEVIHLRPRILQSKRARWIGGATVAAAAVALAFALHLVGPSPSDAEDYWLPALEEAIETSPQPGPPTQLQMALEAYEDHDPARALALLENTNAPQPDEQKETLKRLYQASALVNENRAGEAQQILDDLDISSLQEPWRGRAHWVRYLTLRKNHQDNVADEILESLLQDPGEIGEMARQERARLAGD